MAATVISKVNAKAATATTVGVANKAVIATTAGVANKAATETIEADAVGGFCIRLQASGGEERWTRALRCLLEDLSWLLTWRRAGAATTATGTALHAA